MMCKYMQANWQVFPQLFQVLPAFGKCLYNLIQAWRTCFLFLLEHCAREKNILFTLIIKYKFSLLVPLLMQQLVLVRCIFFALF